MDIPFQKILTNLSSYIKSNNNISSSVDVQNTTSTDDSTSSKLTELIKEQQETTANSNEFSSFLPVFNKKIDELIKQFSLSTKQITEFKKVLIKDFKESSTGQLYDLIKTFVESKKALVKEITSTLKRENIDVEEIGTFIKKNVSDDTYKSSEHSTLNSTLKNIKSYLLYFSRYVDKQYEEWNTQRQGINKKLEERKEEFFKRSSTNESINSFNTNVVPGITQRIIESLTDTTNNQEQLTTIISDLINSIEKSKDSVLSTETKSNIINEIEAVIKRIGNETTNEELPSVLTKFISSVYENTFNTTKKESTITDKAISFISKEMSKVSDFVETTKSTFNKLLTDKTTVNDNIQTIINNTISNFESLLETNKESTISITELNSLFNEFFQNLENELVQTYNTNKLPEEIKSKTITEISEIIQEAIKQIVPTQNQSKETQATEFTKEFLSGMTNEVVKSVIKETDKSIFSKSSMGIALKGITTSIKELIQPKRKEITEQERVNTIQREINKDQQSLLQTIVQYFSSTNKNSSINTTQKTTDSINQSTTTQEKGIFDQISEMIFDRDTNSVEPSKPKKKKGFFRRIFGRTSDIVDETVDGAKKASVFSRLGGGLKSLGKFAAPVAASIDVASKLYTGTNEIKQTGELSLLPQVSEAVSGVSDLLNGDIVSGIEKTTSGVTGSLLSVGTKIGKAINENVLAPNSVLGNIKEQFFDSIFSTVDKLTGGAITGTSQEITNTNFDNSAVGQFIAKTNNTNPVTNVATTIPTNNTNPVAVITGTSQEITNTNFIKKLDSLDIGNVLSNSVDNSNTLSTLSSTLQNKSPILETKLRELSSVTNENKQKELSTLVTASTTINKVSSNSNEKRTITGTNISPGELLITRNNDSAIRSVVESFLAYSMG